jgi:hypothetical protein
VVNRWTQEGKTHRQRRDNLMVTRMRSEADESEPKSGDVVRAFEPVMDEHD